MVTYLLECNKIKAGNFIIDCYETCCFPSVELFFNSSDIKCLQLFIRKNSQRGFLHLKQVQSTLSLFEMILQKLLGKHIKLSHSLCLTLTVFNGM